MRRDFIGRTRIVIVVEPKATATPPARRVLRSKDILGFMRRFTETTLLRDFPGTNPEAQR
jgi:hypothetical protein